MLNAAIRWMTLTYLALIAVILAFDLYALALLLRHGEADLSVLKNLMETLPALSPIVGLSWIVLAATALLFAVLLNREYRESAGFLEARWSSHWAITGWIVPVLNLFVPFQIVGDTLKAKSGCDTLPRRLNALRWTWWLGLVVLLPMIMNVPRSLDAAAVDRTAVAIAGASVAGQVVAIVVLGLWLAAGFAFYQITDAISAGSQAVSMPSRRALATVTAFVGLIALAGTLVLPYGQAWSRRLGPEFECKVGSITGGDRLRCSNNGRHVRIDRTELDNDRAHRIDYEIVYKFLLLQHTLGKTLQCRQVGWSIGTAKVKCTEGGTDVICAMRPKFCEQRRSSAATLDQPVAL